jgi:peroxiredoxin
MSSTKHKGAKPPIPATPPRSFGVMWWLVPLTVGVILFGLYGIFNSATASKKSGATRAYDIGRPATGEAAPAFTLPDNAGRQISLSEYRGKSVLLYFQEGLTCPPCWDQMSVLEKQPQQLKAAGIDAVVSITTDPVNLIARKVSDLGLTTPVLSDPTMDISRKYQANRFGMMGDSRDGHTFILVGPEGKIRWRADYGGPPTYTMFVPVERLLKDLRASLKS